MYKICACIFSTNRTEYLSRTLNAQRSLDFSGCEVERILFDDFPLGRDDMGMAMLAATHGYNHVVLHGENKGIGATWGEFWDSIRYRDFDYVWHQEDDVVILEPVSVAALIDIIRVNPELSQVVLKRQPWYRHEKPSEALRTDSIHGNLRGEFTDARVYFTPIASLYSMDRVRFDYREFYRTRYPDEPSLAAANINEGLIGKALLESGGLTSMHIKSSVGRNLIEHIGEYTQGRRLLPGEPGYETWAHFIPEQKYDAISGRPYVR